MNAFSTTLEPQTKSGIKNLIARHPFVAYFLIAFVGTWLLDLPMVLGQDGLGIFPYQVPTVLYVILFVLSAFTGPTVGAFVVTNAMDGKVGTRKLFRRYFQWRVGFVWYLVALLGIPLVFLAITSILTGSIPIAELQQNGAAFLSAYLFAVLIFPALITWGEEPGWRGFAQTRMQERYGALPSALVVGFLHGVWHLPIFLLVNGPVASGPFNLTSFLTNTLVAMGLTVIYTWVFNGANQSILIAVLVHASGNATSSQFGKLIPQPPAELGIWVIGFYIVFALVLIVLSRGRLGYRPAQAVSEANTASPFVLARK